MLGGGIYDLHQGATDNFFASLLGSFHIVHLYLTADGWTMVAWQLQPFLAWFISSHQAGQHKFKVKRHLLMCMDGTEYMDKMKGQHFCLHL